MLAFLCEPPAWPRGVGRHHSTHNTFARCAIRNPAITASCKPISGACSLTCGVGNMSQWHVLAKPGSRLLGDSTKSSFASLTSAGTWVRIALLHPHPLVLMLRIDRVTHVALNNNNAAECGRCRNGSAYSRLTNYGESDSLERGLC